MTRPAHAKDFKGGAKCIPARDTFLLKYQSDWVLDKSLMRLMEKTRRAGITFATAYDYVREHSQAGSLVDTFFSSRDELTGREFILYCKKFAGALDKGAQDLGERVIDEHGTNAHVLQFTAGKRIYSLSSNPDAFAGKGGNAGVDELALRDDPRAVVAISQATIDWGGRWAGISTHRGSANWFNQTVQEIKHKQNPKGISLHTVTLERALAEGFLWKLQCKLREDDPRMAMDETAYFNFIRSRSPDQETFNQEYMCIPDDDASAFISFELIDACKYRAEEKWELTLAELALVTNPLYVGIDIGRKHDLTSIWLNERIAGTHFTRLQIDLKAMPFSQQEAIIYPILALPGVRRACFDNTGIGMQMAERAQQRFGTSKVEAVTFTASVKEELAYPVRAACEDRTLRLPDRPEIVSDFRGIRKETTAAGNSRFTGERSESGHCDRFWSCALALHAGKTSNSTYRAALI
jgi:phage FluMu gp28-like protein